MADEKFTIDGTEHEVGNADCPSCYSQPNMCDCGGVMHSEFLDDDDDNIYTITLCDKCGESE